MLLVLGLLGALLALLLGRCSPQTRFQVFSALHSRLAGSGFPRSRAPGWLPVQCGLVLGFGCLTLSGQSHPKDLSIQAQTGCGHRSTSPMSTSWSLSLTRPLLPLLFSTKWDPGKHLIRVLFPPGWWSLALTVL